ncbi:MAG TPA: 2'-deoxycytidine 5'-triphosphate deaminase [Terriglobia bacterium]|nr:2'-deoxycytidine 5'-triphosphate deaminase [Terriglobia bacterium]
MASVPLFKEIKNYQSCGEGILPSQELRHFVDNGVICSHREIEPEQIQPASIDLRLWDTAYRVRASFLPSKSTTLLNKATTNGLFDTKLDISEPTLLEPRAVYIIRLVESLALPSDVYGVANAKSTTGRLDIFTRLITEVGDEFERVPKGYRGDLYIQVVSRSFPILVRSGMKLNQLRLVRGRSNPVADSGLKELAKDDLLVFNEEPSSEQGDINRGLRITVDLKGTADSDIVAYEAKRYTQPVSLNQVQYYDPADFWSPIRKPEKGYIVLEPENFYLLASKQPVRVGPDHAAEMVPYDPTTGEFHVHYAGFFDPGFGYGVGGEIQGSKAVLEVRAHGMPVMLEDDQFVGRLNYYKMAATPDKVYGVSIGSSYQKQGLALSKQFKQSGFAEREKVMSTSDPDAMQGVPAKHSLTSRNEIKRRSDLGEDDSILDIAFPQKTSAITLQAKTRT